MKDQPQAAKTPSSIQLEQVQQQATTVRESENVELKIVETGSKAVLCEFSSDMVFLSEHILYFWFIRATKKKVYSSFARHRQLASFKPFAILYGEDKFVIAQAIQTFKKEFPRSIISTLPATFPLPTDFPSESFYFSFTPSFLPSSSFKRGQILLEDYPHFFFLRPSMDYLYSMLPVPTVLFDPAIFRYQESSRYHLSNYETSDRIKTLQSNGKAISVYDSQETLTRKYYKARSKRQEWFVDMCSSHPFNFHPEVLNEQQKGQRKIMNRYDVESGEVPIKRIQAPQDKFQVLNINFRFGIAMIQLNSAPQSNHPELKLQQERLKQHQMELEERQRDIEMGLEEIPSQEQTYEQKILKRKRGDIV